MGSTRTPELTHTVEPRYKDVGRTDEDIITVTGLNRLIQGDSGLMASSGSSSECNRDFYCLQAGMCQRSLFYRYTTS